MNSNKRYRYSHEQIIHILREIEVVAEARKNK